MNELIKINTDHQGKKSVSAKELHSQLGFSKPHWKRWYIKNIIDNEFVIEHEDWEGFTLMVNGNPTRDFAISINFAKRLCMLARTEKGEEIRQYFIECEKRAKDPMFALNDPGILRNTLLSYTEKVLALEATVKEQAPKVLFADSVDASDDTILVGELAKILKQNGVPNMGQNRFFRKLRDDGFLMKRHGIDWNMPTQRSMEAGLFEIKERTIIDSNGEVLLLKTPRVTGKGQQYFINKYMPCI